MGRSAAVRAPEVALGLLYLSEEVQLHCCGARRLAAARVGGCCNRRLALLR